MIKAVIFDLDDTLYFEIEYVKSGFSAVAAAFNYESLFYKLWSLFEVSKKDVYQRAGMNRSDCEKSINVYRTHIPDISLSDSVFEVLDTLKKRGYVLGIITDGRPEGQHNKIKSLGLEKIVSHIIVTDELGGVEYRKPNPKAFEIMREKCGLEYSEMIYVGDNAHKDFKAPKLLGMKTCFFSSPLGLYPENNADTDFSISELSELLEIF